LSASLTFPHTAAACIGCHPSLSAISTDAPCSSRNSRTSIYPLAVAMWTWITAIMMNGYNSNDNDDGDNNDDDDDNDINR